jgi:Ca2+-binding EF-hand superfamily protein
MADELSGEHEEYFKKMFDEFDIDGNNEICKEVLEFLLRSSEY